jgi:hypothetical protein
MSYTSRIGLQKNNKIQHVTRVVACCFVAPIGVSENIAL